VIGSLRGTLLDRSTAGEVLIEVAGVGYRATMGPAAALTLGDVGSEVFVWVHHHIREDAQALYAFSGRDERTCFEALLGAHGVGPSLALAILSVHRPDALRGVLASDDVDALCLVPGVGKKTAARLLVELKSRLDAGEIDPAAISAAAGGSTSSERPVLADVRDALAGLGYGPDEVAAVLREVRPEPGDDAGDVLKRALQHLAVAR
jgi:Holliday junction DNA helicase RuvA